MDVHSPAIDVCNHLFSVNRTQTVLLETFSGVFGEVRCSAPQTGPPGRQWESPGRRGRVGETGLVDGASPGAQDLSRQSIRRDGEGGYSRTRGRGRVDKENEHMEHTRGLSVLQVPVVWRPVTSEVRGLTLGRPKSAVLPGTDTC